MPKSRLFLSKKEWNSDSENILKAGRLLYDLFKVGPWRVDVSLLARLKEPFDYTYGGNILRDALVPDPGSQAEYIYRNIEDKIFVVWQKKHSVDFNNFQTFVGNSFRARTQEVLEAFAIAAPELKAALGAFPWKQLSLPVAQRADVEKYCARCFPTMTNYGVCKNGDAFNAVNARWGFYSGPYTP